MCSPVAMLNPNIQGPKTDVNTRPHADNQFPRMCSDSSPSLVSTQAKPKPKPRQAKAIDWRLASRWSHFQFASLLPKSNTFKCSKPCSTALPKYRPVLTINCENPMKNAPTHKENSHHSLPKSKWRQRSVMMTTEFCRILPIAQTYVLFRIAFTNIVEFIF